MVGDDRFASTDNHLDVGSIAAIDNIFLGEQVGGGDDHSTQLVECQDAEPELYAPLEDKHHHVAATNAQLLEVGGRQVTVVLHVGKGVLAVFALVVGPEQGWFVGFFSSPCIHYVVGEVE